MRPRLFQGDRPPTSLKSYDKPPNTELVNLICIFCVSKELAQTAFRVCTLSTADFSSAHVLGWAGFVMRPQSVFLPPGLQNKEICSHVALMAKGKIHGKCKFTLPSWAFYANCNGSDGLGHNCKQCTRRYDKLRRAAEKEWMRHVRFRSDISLTHFVRYKTTAPDPCDVQCPRFLKTPLTAAADV